MDAGQYKDHQLPGSADTRLDLGGNEIHEMVTFYMMTIKGSLMVVLNIPLTSYPGPFEVYEIRAQLHCASDTRAKFSFRLCVRIGIHAFGDAQRDWRVCGVVTRRCAQRQNVTASFVAVSSGAQGRQHVM